MDNSCELFENFVHIQTILGNKLLEGFIRSICFIIAILSTCDCFFKDLPEGAEAIQPLDSCKIDAFYELTLEFISRGSLNLCSGSEAWSRCNRSFLREVFVGTKLSYFYSTRFTLIKL